MNLRSILFLLTVGLISVLGIVGCASTPTPEPTAVPTNTPLPPPTTVPTNTALPPTPTRPPTNTPPPPPPTNTPIPLSPTPTATNTFVPVTRAPTATPTETAIPLLYAAPILVAPGSGDAITAGRDDIIFRWKPVGPLASNQCYLVTLRITNIDTGEYGEQSFVAERTCNDAGQTNPVTFAVSRRAPAPDYAGLLAIAGDGVNYSATWSVIVIQNNGADPNKPDPASYIPISPPSAPFVFEVRG